MKWEEIIAVSGKPGLYRIVGHTKSGVFAEHLTEKKKIVAPLIHISSMPDIAVFTQDDEIRLPEVFEKIHQADKEGKTVPGKKSSKNELTAFFKDIIPDYDEDKFYPSHMRKILGWYEVLKEADIWEKAE